MNKTTEVSEILALIGAMTTAKRYELSAQQTNEAQSVSALGAINALSELDHEIRNRLEEEAKPAPAEANPQPQQTLLEGKDPEGQFEDKTPDRSEEDAAQAHAASKQEIIHSKYAKRDADKDSALMSDPNSVNVKMTIAGQTSTMYVGIIKAAPDKPGAKYHHRDTFHILLVGDPATEMGSSVSRSDSTDIHFPGSKGNQYDKIDKLLVHVMRVNENDGNMYKYRRVFCDCFAQALRNCGYLAAKKK